MISQGIILASDPYGQFVHLWFLRVEIPILITLSGTYFTSIIFLRTTRPVAAAVIAVVLAFATAPGTWALIRGWHDMHWSLGYVLPLYPASGGGYEVLSWPIRFAATAWLWRRLWKRTDQGEIDLV